MLSLSLTSAPAAARPPARRPAALVSRATVARPAGAVAPAATKLQEVEMEDKVKAKADDEVEFEDFDDGVGLTTGQVQAVMGVLCDETDIAELSVRLGGFELHVRRSLKPGGGAGSATAAAANSAAPPIPTPSPASAFASTASMDGAGLPVGMSTATTATTSLDEEEETMILLGAPKVGVMRRGRYVKGKAVGKGPVVEVGATIKKGQVLGFVEQLGTFVAIESPQAGELVSFLADEGAPVEYGEPVCEIAPYFSGHIIGDAKHF